MEEGEVETDHTFHSNSWYHEDVDISDAVHLSSIEWPEDPTPCSQLSSAEGHDTPSAYSGSPSPSSPLRLLVQRSAILRRHQRLALLDGFSEIQLGRDNAPAGSGTPKIRLKEMEVSKLHATIYWDYNCSQWSIVDMGSKHGTFVLPAGMPSPAGSTDKGTDEKGVRLSAPRVSSMPRMLRHQDCLTIGGTVFVCHIHEDRTPCSDCSPQGGDEIPLSIYLTSNNDAASNKKRKLNVSATVPPTLAHQRDPKKALAMLKHSLLTAKHPVRPSTRQSTQSYVDRSARRRALHPEHTAPTPPAMRADSAIAASLSLSTPTTPLTSTPISTPAPISSSNIGHQLLMKQGWQPGTPLGDPSDNPGLVAPLDPPSTVGRAGIGIPVRSVSHQDEDWRGAGKSRRWEEIRRADDIQ